MVIHLFSYSFSFWSVFNVLPLHFLFTEDQVCEGAEFKVIFLGAIALGWQRV